MVFSAFDAPEVSDTAVPGLPVSPTEPTSSALYRKRACLLHSGWNELLDFNFKGLPYVSTSS